MFSTAMFFEKNENIAKRCFRAINRQKTSGSIYLAKSRPIDIDKIRSSFTDYYNNK